MPGLVQAQRDIARLPGRFRSRPEEISSAPMEAALRAHAEGTGRFLLAVAGATTIAHGWLLPQDSVNQRHVVALQLAVHEGHQGQGIGAQLLDALIAWARAQPALRKIVLTVRERNERALRLYRARGFVVHGRVVESLRLADGTTFDDLLMTLWLPRPAAESGAAAVILRPAVAADFEAIARLGDEVNGLHHDRHPAVFTPRGDRVAHAAFWRARWHDGEHFIVAEQGGAVVGFVCGSVVDEKQTALVNAMRLLRAGSVAVSAASRGQGIGTRLMQALADWGREQGAVELRLNVWDFNRGAMRLYERLGYELRSHYYALPLQ